MKPYDTVEYARSRLVETIICLNGKPVQVVEVNNRFIDHEIIVGFNYLSSGDSGVDVLENFDLNPVKLGYVNYQNNAHYLSRMPMRKDWRQGLRSINISDPFGGRPSIPYKVIAETIVGNYPTFHSALEKINSSEEDKRVAFCRDFSMFKDILTYKGVMDVGKINTENGTITIDEPFNWVTESLYESMENAA